MTEATDQRGVTARVLQYRLTRCLDGFTRYVLHDDRETASERAARKYSA